MLLNGSGRSDAVALEDSERVGIRGGIGSARTRGDVRGVVPRHVRDDERQHGRPAGPGEPAPLNRGEMLAHRVDFLDWSTAPQKLFRGRLERLHSYAGGR